jgi:TBC1 domain family protein 5
MTLVSHQVKQLKSLLCSAYDEPETGERDEHLEEAAYRDSLLQQRLTSIHNSVLLRCDPPLANHLAAIGVEPQMYLLRWVRLLMAGEFSLQQVWLVWDAVFALTPQDFSLVEYLCVAMVRQLRPQLLAEKDCTGALMQLLNSRGEVDIDVVEVVRHAQRLRETMLS